MRSTSRNGIPVRQNPFDRRVVERQRQVHVIHQIILSGTDRRADLDSWPDRSSALRLPIRPCRTAIEALPTLFALGREVTSVLDLDELLPKIPAADRPPDQISSVCRLPARSERRRAHVAYSVGYPDDVARTLRLKVGHGLVGAAVAEGQPLLVNDVRADPRYVEAVPGSNAELVVPLRRKGRVIGALNLLSDTVGAVHRDRRGGAAPVRRARRGGDRERAAVRARARVHEHARNARRRSRASSASILNLDELLTRIANLTRASSTTGRSASCCQRETHELEMKVAVRYGEKVSVPRTQDGQRPGRLRRAPQGAGARAGRLGRSALHQGRRGRRARSW